jgi:hypothetical protein
VVANSQKLAHHAALKVKVEYSNVRKPVIDLREIIASGNERRVTAHREPGYKPQGKLATYIIRTNSYTVQITMHQTSQNYQMAVLVLKTFSFMFLYL